MVLWCVFFFFFSSRRRHTRCSRDWSSDVCSSDLGPLEMPVRLTVCRLASSLIVRSLIGSRVGGWFTKLTVRSEERRVGKGVDLGGRRIIKKKKKKDQEEANKEE